MTYLINVTSVIAIALTMTALSWGKPLDPATNTPSGFGGDEPVCDTNDDGEVNDEDEEGYVCDLEGNDGENDACYRCDTNGNGFADSCAFQCDTMGCDGIDDTCHVCDVDEDGNMDMCKVSAGDYVALMTFDNREQDPCYTNTPNGCGSDGLNVPDDPSPGPNNSFHACCNSHDAGYGTCGRSKTSTDDHFLLCMYGACSNAYESGDNDQQDYVQCMSLASTYYQAVHHGGTDAYKSGQVDSCIGCLP